MKRNLLVGLICLSSFWSRSQSSSDAAVQLVASVQAFPSQITLSWPGNGTTSQYQVFRKLKSATTWGTVLATLSGTVNQYVDNTAIFNTNYEYRVIRVGSGYTAYGFINTGIEVAETEFRGNMILVIDSSFIGTLAAEITRLVKDLEGDGWKVIRHNVDKNGSVLHVKSIILNDYTLDPVNTKAVFLLGHVPVPYSGNINPDGHPDHLGAWPADVYYGDMNGTWTDASVNSTTASPVRTQNVPGDGKFDQSLVPGDVELQVGRVDMANLPAFASSEQQLLKNYLDKDHDYRKKIFVPERRAVIDDNFGYFSGEAFAASGYKNFGPLVGTASITAADYFTTMTGNSYLWSYGCGGGSFTSAGGIGTTTNFAASNLQGVFTMLFGSYFGDWDVQNSFLRAPLAQGRMLTNMWSGRPHYQLHHMGLGENIGFSLLTTQNNPGTLYFASPVGISGKWIHNSLMGDPSLRNDVVAPVSNVVATHVGFNCNITWTASPDTMVKGYHIYMRNDSTPGYTRLNAQAIMGTQYTDSCLLVKGIYEYMVRAIKLEKTTSGSYYNLSEGISDTAFNTVDFSSLAAFSNTVMGVNVQFNATGSISAQYSWSFGNGQSSSLVNPLVTYTNNGTYTVQLIASHPCIQDTNYALVTIWEVGLNENKLTNDVTFYPNPGNGLLFFSSTPGLVYEISVMDADGKVIMNKPEINNGDSLDMRAFSKGVYFVKIKQDNSAVLKKIILE